MPKYTEQAVRDAVAAARSLSEALRTLGLRPAGGNHRTLHRLIAKYGISVDHMDPKWALRRAPRNCATPLPEILVVDSTFHRGHLKERLFHEGVKKRRCELCGLGEEWCGRPMSLTLDHINGVPTDNRIGNLRIVCLSDPLGDGPHSLGPVSLATPTHVDSPASGGLPSIS